jgi:A/G-specific adenine glycosylase
MTKIQIARFRNDLLQWFSKNKRHLPWRKNPDWYKTYLSEIILQQTTVDQGLPYFQKFLSTFPTINDLARANEEQVLHLWAGLGYYSRGRNLLKAAKIIVNDHNAFFPDDYKHALKIPGIGPYSAAAILSIAFKKPHAAIDGNVIRVVARLYAVRDDTRLTTTLNIIKNRTGSLLDKDNPGNFNEAMMELGATVCTPKKPKCTCCPVNSFCTAFKKNLIENIPLRSAAKARHKKYHVACILKQQSKILIGRRPQSGLLAGMWELPVIEIKQKNFENALHKVLKEKDIILQSESPVFRHMYSHIDLRYKAITADNNIGQNFYDYYIDHKWIDLNEAENYAIHNAHKKILNWYQMEINNQNPTTNKK